jgi:hypothetical protein
MRKNNLLITLSFIFIITCLTSCEAIGDIFKAGMWFAVIGIFLIVGLVIFILGKFRN